MHKILFIQPTQYAGDGKLCKQRRINLPGLAFPLLAAYTPPHWEVEILIEVVDEVNFETDADIIGIGTMGHAMYRGIEIADQFRARGKTVVMGGYMASIMPSVAVQHADSVIIGDAEQAWPELLKDFENQGKLKQVYEIPVQHLEGLPVPRYDLLTKKPIGNMLPVQAGRGCPYSCSFCSIACLYHGKYFFRPVDEVLRDIIEVKKLGFKRFYLIDDNIASNPKYLKELCEKITPLKMHWASQCTLRLARDPELLELVVRSGCDLMSFGLESIDQAALDSVNKSWLKASDHEKNLAKLSKAGIMLSTEMILGTDEDTEQSIMNIYDFINKTKIAIPRFYILTPVPGTKLFETYQKEGRLLTEDLRQYDGSRCVHHPRKVSANRVGELYWWLNNKVFSLYSILIRTLFNKELWRNPRNVLFALFVNLHYRRYVKRKTVPNIL